MGQGLGLSFVKNGVLVTMLTNPFAQAASINILYGGLPRRIDGKHDERIGLIEGAREMVKKGGGPCVSMRLKHNDDPAVRRNTALVLGLMDEPGAVKLLARAMKDRDTGVQHHALEAMARLGNPEAKQELAFMTAAGVGSEETFAVRALSNTGDRKYLDTLRYKLESAAHLETRLEAARGLGKFGVDYGF